jgi:hypothetical protein
MESWTHFAALSRPRKGKSAFLISFPACIDIHDIIFISFAAKHRNFGEANRICKAGISACSFGINGVMGPRIMICPLHQNANRSNYIENLRILNWLKI